MMNKPFNLTTVGIATCSIDEIAHDRALHLIMILFGGTVANIPESSAVTSCLPHPPSLFKLSTSPLSSRILPRIQYAIADTINIKYTFENRNREMSSQSSSTFQSSSSTNSNGNPYTESTSSNPSGITIQPTTQEAGQPATTETTRVPAAQQVGGVDNSTRIEESEESEADQLYAKNIEDEYAKREGGA